MKYYIDRITQGKAVLEDENGGRTVINAALLPEGAREGSAVYESDGKFLPDEKEERRRRRLLFKLQNRIKTKKNRH